MYSLLSTSKKKLTVCCVVEKEYEYSQIARDNFLKVAKTACLMVSEFASDKSQCDGYVLNTPLKLNE